MLIRAQAGEEGAWEDLCQLYRPLIVGWLRRQAVPAGEVDDLVQEIFLAVVRGLPSFSHSGRRGAFRTWLRMIASNRSSDYWKSPARLAVARGGDAAAAALGMLEDPDSPLNRYWVEEHDRYVLRCLLELADLEFEPTSVRAFRRCAGGGLRHGGRRRAGALPRRGLHRSIARFAKAAGSGRGAARRLAVKSCQVAIA